MTIPHIIFKQQAKKRLIGKEGKEKEREIRELLSEMPGYKTGPYGEIRKWLVGEMRENRKRGRAKAKHFFDIKKEGDAQIVLLGAPNIGKSSLLRKLSSIQIKVADYAFTTLKPIPAIVNFGGALVQIVEIPGLLRSASEGRGGGRAMLAAARNANYTVLMTSIDTPIEKTKAVYNEIRGAKLSAPRFLICSKIDLPNAEKALADVRGNFPDMAVLPISTETGAGLQELKDQLWGNLHLIRVFPEGRSGGSGVRPVVIPQGSTVEDAVERLMRSNSGRSRFTKIRGPSAKFAGQQVGGEHVLMDGDRLEIH